MRLLSWTSRLLSLKSSSTAFPERETCDVAPEKTEAIVKATEVEDEVTKRIKEARARIIAADVKYKNYNRRNPQAHT